MHSQDDIHYALETTKVLREPDRRIDTFGETRFEFQLISELMDRTGEVRIELAIDRRPPARRHARGFHRHHGADEGAAAIGADIALDDHDAELARRRLGRLGVAGDVQQLADLAQRFPDTLRSDNPVVDKSGRYVAYQFGFSMEFADQAAYTAYNVHPKHVKFVKDRWEREVERFLEIDYVPV